MNDQYLKDALAMVDALTDGHQERELRAEFEEWAAKRAPGHPAVRRPNGEYLDYATECAWQGFAAGRRSSPSTQRQGEEARDAALRVWLDAETASRAAIAAYNAAVQESDKYIWPGTDINAEFQGMSQAKNKAFHAMHALYDAFCSAHPADAPEGGK